MTCHSLTLTQTQSASVRFTTFVSWFMSWNSQSHVQGDVPDHKTTHKEWTVVSWLIICPTQQWPKQWQWHRANSGRGAPKPWPRLSRLRFAYLGQAAPGSSRARTPHASAQVSSSAGPAVNQVKNNDSCLGQFISIKVLPNLPEHPTRSFDVRQLHHLVHDVSETAYKDLFSDHNSMTCSSSYIFQEQSSAEISWLAALIDIAYRWSMRYYKMLNCDLLKLETGSLASLRSLETGVIAWKVTSHFRSLGLKTGESHESPTVCGGLNRLWELPMYPTYIWSGRHFINSCKFVFNTWLPIEISDGYWSFC